MWIVTQDYVKGQLVYLVENSVTGERRGEFDWQAIAQEFADELNIEERRPARIDALYISKNILHRAIDNGVWAEADFPESKKKCTSSLTSMMGKRRTR